MPYQSDEYGNLYWVDEPYTPPLGVYEVPMNYQPNPLYAQPNYEQYQAPYTPSPAPYTAPATAQPSQAPAPAGEYGVRNADGSVSVIDAVTGAVKRTESWAQNQGLSPTTTTTTTAAGGGGGGTYSTREGTKTAAQMLSELDRAAGGYWSGGNRNDPNAIFQAYQNVKVSTGAGQVGAGQYGQNLNVAPTELMALEIQQLHEKYLQERLRLLEIPTMEADTELRRHQLALDAANSFATQSGWMIPSAYIERMVLSDPNIGAGLPQQAAQAMQPLGQYANQQQAIQTARTGLASLDNSWAQASDQDIINKVLSDQTLFVNQPDLRAALQNQFQPMPTAAPTTGQAYTGTGQFPGVMPTFEREQYMTNLAANPRNLAQTLMMLGFNSQQTGQFLQNTPLVQALTYGGQYAGGLPTAGTGGTNPDFPFIQGRQLPVRQTLAWQNQQSPMIDMLSGLFSASGQTPESAFGEFQQFIPKGSTMGVTSY